MANNEERLCLKRKTFSRGERITQKVSEFL